MDETGINLLSFHMCSSSGMSEKGIGQKKISSQQNRSIRLSAMEWINTE